MSEVKCAVPGCDNTLTEDQRNKRISVCSDCEAAQMHLCESCGKRISADRISDGATLCKECEVNPNDLVEGDTYSYEEYEEEGTEEDFMV